MSSDNPFDVSEDRYVLPPEPKFDPHHKAFGCVDPHPERVRKHQLSSKRDIPTVILYDGKPWEQLTPSEKIEAARGNKTTFGSGSVAHEQLFYVKLRLVPAGATISTYREFEDVTSVKFEEHWLRIFDKTGDYTFPRERVIEVETTRQP